jgi:dipeptidyl-peptidase-4
MGSLKTNRTAHEYASNLRLADRLKGKLLLIHGTSDSETPLSNTMKLLDAFSRANKPYDLLILPD